LRFFKVIWSARLGAKKIKTNSNEVLGLSP
jgi:hypothetical protein